jgi:hypothetical protein
MRMRPWWLSPLLPVALILPGCGSTPNAIPTVTTGTNLVASTTAIGPVVHTYRGQTTLAEPATLTQDSTGVMRLVFSKSLTPAAGPAYTVSDSLLWSGLSGIGTFYLATQSVSFPDAANATLSDRDDCGGILVLNGDGTFTLTLTVTGIRFPAGTAPSQTTTVIGVYSGGTVANG